MKSTPSVTALERAVEARAGTLAASRGAGARSCGQAFDPAAPSPGEACVDLGCGRGANRSTRRRLRR